MGGAWNKERESIIAVKLSIKLKSFNLWKVHPWSIIHCHDDDDLFVIKHFFCPKQLTEKRFLINREQTDDPRRGQSRQCDQIGQFITLWATFHSPWQQLICPNCPHNLPNFCKGVKIYPFSSEIILGNFYRYLAFFLVSLEGDETTVSDKPSEEHKKKNGVLDVEKRHSFKTLTNTRFHLPISLPCHPHSLPLSLSLSPT